MTDNETEAPPTPPEDETTEPVQADDTPVETDNPYNIVVLQEAAVASDNFLVGLEPNNSGAEVLFIRPKGWVGPSPLNAAPERLGELLDLLTALNEKLTS